MFLSGIGPIPVLAEENPMSSKLASTVRRAFAVALFALPCGLAITAASPTEAVALNPCNNVDISVTNNHPSKNPIRISYIKYQVNGAGSWYKEGFTNSVPNYGVTAKWSNQDLGSFPEGSNAKFRVYFEEQLSGGTFPRYDSMHYQEFDRTGQACKDGRSYTFTVDSAGTPGT